MKKRTITIVAVLAAITMLSFAVFAGNDTYAGYERFKDLLRNDQDMEIDHGEGSVVVIDNGKVAVSVNAEFAEDQLSEGGYGIVTIESEEIDKTLEVYSQGEAVYLVDGSDVYMGSQSDDEYNYHSDFESDFEVTEEFNAKSEAIMDILMDDFKHNFTLEGENIVFELTKEEMPALLNVLASSDKESYDRRDEMSVEMANYPLFEELSSLETVLPELTETEIEYLKVVLLVNRESVTGVQANIIVKGLDENGEMHQVEVKSEFSSSKDEFDVKSFELTDETVYEIKEER